MSRKKRASRNRRRAWQKPSMREFEDSASGEDSAPEENSESEEDSEDDFFEFSFDEDSGLLELSCEQRPFELVRDLIVGLCDSSKIKRDEVRVIKVHNKAAIAERGERRAPRWFSYGCLATVLFVIVSTVIGVVTIVRWIVHR